MPSSITYAIQVEYVLPFPIVAIAALFRVETIVRIYITGKQPSLYLFEALMLSTDLRWFRSACGQRTNTLQNGIVSIENRSGAGTFWRTSAIVEPTSPFELH